MARLVGHCPTRLEICVDWLGAHLVPACSHGPSAPALCGAKPRNLAGDVQTTRACPSCAHQYRTRPHHLPCGPDHLLALFGVTPDPPDPLLSCRRTLESLDRVILPELGPLGTINAAEADGLCHADQWCADHDGPMEERPIGLTEDGSLDVGQPLHCQRDLPRPVESALYHAVRMQSDRDALRGLGTLSPWDLYSVVTGAPRRGDLTLDHLSRPLPSFLPKPMLRLHETNRALYGILSSAVEEWARSGWARYETNRRVVYGLAGRGLLPRSVMSLCVIHVHSGPVTVVVDPAQLTAGGQISVLETEHIFGAWMQSQGLSQESIEDAVDAIRTMDRTLGHLSQHLLDSHSGRIVRLEREVPAEWMVWPHRKDSDGASHCWLPELLANSIVDAQSTQFHRAMSESTAWAVLNSS